MPRSTCRTWRRPVFAYKLTPQWTVLGEFDYTTWSNFKQIDIQTASPSLGNLVTNENYRDTYGISHSARNTN